MRQVRFNYWAINTGPQLPFVKIDNIVVFFQWHQPDPTPTAVSAQNAIITNILKRKNFRPRTKILPIYEWISFSFQFW